MPRQPKTNEDFVNHMRENPPSTELEETSNGLFNALDTSGALTVLRQIGSQYPPEGQFDDGVLTGIAIGIGYSRFIEAAKAISEPAIAPAIEAPAEAPTSQENAMATIGELEAQALRDIAEGKTISAERAYEVGKQIAAELRKTGDEVGAKILEASNETLYKLVKLGLSGPTAVAMVHNIINRTYSPNPQGN